MDFPLTFNALPDRDKPECGLCGFPVQVTVSRETFRDVIDIQVICSHCDLGLTGYIDGMELYSIRDKEDAFAAILHKIQDLANFLGSSESKGFSPSQLPKTKKFFRKNAPWNF